MTVRHSVSTTIADGLENTPESIQTFVQEEERQQRQEKKLVLLLPDFTAGCNIGETGSSRLP